MMTYVLIAAVAIVAILIVAVAVQPAAFLVVRSATIDAPPGEVFGRVNELRAWPEWSPWAKIDPGMVQTYEGPAAGEGAVSAWSGNNKVGAGRMTITQSRPEELVRFRLEFLRPFKATNEADFTFEPDGGGTRVTWGMTGNKNFMFKAVCLVADMDKMCGRDFEKGLAQLKTICEASAEPVVGGARA